MSAPLFVHPGHVVVARGVGELVTILGSCVAVCLHDREAGIGGMNHFLLPDAGDPRDPPGRYAPTAVARLVDAATTKGARRERLVAHVVGGARVLAAFASGAEHLGSRNVRAALAALEALRIPVVCLDVGGTRGRRLSFAVADGTCTVRQVGA